MMRITKRMITVELNRYRGENNTPHIY